MSTAMLSHASMYFPHVYNCNCSLYCGSVAFSIQVLFNNVVPKNFRKLLYLDATCCMKSPKQRQVLLKWQKKKGFLPALITRTYFIFMYIFCVHISTIHLCLCLLINIYLLVHIYTSFFISSSCTFVKNILYCFV